MRPGGANCGEESGGELPLALAVARMEPAVDLTPPERKAWLDAAGPLYRLRRGEDITRPGQVLYRALAEGREIGYLRLALPRRRVLAWVEAVWVDVDRRRQGIGRRLVQETLAVDLDGQRQWLIADVPRANPAARDFFDALGFRPQGRPPRKTCDWIRWALPL